MNILIAIPSISYKTVRNLPPSLVCSRPNWLDDRFLDMGAFKPTLSTLDVFPKEMEGLTIPWGIGIPNWPLAANCTNGVAGPGLPKDELFVPEGIRDEMERLAGHYDKWRPYPAEVPLSSYATKIAKKFAGKRAKMFDHVFRHYKPDTLFWVEHAAASLACVDESEAMEVFGIIAERALGSMMSTPAATFVLFSPYGTGRRSGFVVSNRIEPGKINSWDKIRLYLNGKL